MKNVPKLTCLNTKATSTVTFFDALLPYIIFIHTSTLFNQGTYLSLRVVCLWVRLNLSTSGLFKRALTTNRDSPADLIAIRYILAMILV